MQKLRETFIRGLELKADLMRNEDRKESENIAYDDIFDAVNKRCEELKDKIPRFEMKDKIEFPSWHGCPATKHRRRSLTSEKKLWPRKRWCSDCNQTCTTRPTLLRDNIQTVETGQEDIRGVSISGFLTTDCDLELGGGGAQCVDVLR